LDEDVRAFIREHIEDFEQLEVLRTVHERRDQGVTRDALAARLAIQPSDVQDAVNALSRVGLVTVASASNTVHVAYGVEDSVLEARVRKTLLAYEQNRLEIILFMNAIARARGDSLVLELFSNAFLLRRK
jgi:hypothetical protein